MTTETTNPTTATYPMFRKAGNGDTVRGARYQYATEESVLNPGQPNWTLRSFTLDYAKKLARGSR